MSEEVIQEELDMAVKSAEEKDDEYIETALNWFDSNPEKNNYLLLEETEKLKWNQAIVHDVDSVVIVEIPIKLKKKFILKVTNKEKLNVEQRLLLINRNGEYSSLMEFIISEKNKEELEDPEKTNYTNKSNNFEGTIVCVNLKGEVVSVKKFGEDKSPSVEILLKSAAKSCIGLFEIFSDGTQQLVGILYCWIDGDGELGGGSSGGSGSSTSVSGIPGTDDCPCTVCDVCNKCKNDLFKSAPAGGGEGSEEVEIECPLCSCPTIDITGVENNEKTLCIFNNLIKTAVVEYNPLVTSFLMEFSEGIAVEPEDIIFKLDNLSGIYGQCDPSGNQYEVTLNINEISNRAPVEIAKTLIHEILHAQIMHSVQTTTGSFVDVFGQYIKTKTGNTYIDQHDLMLDHYVNPMINFLKDYDSLSGISASDSYYRSLALSGLEPIITSEEMNDLIEAQNYFRQRGLNCN